MRSSIRGTVGVLMKKIRFLLFAILGLSSLSADERYDEKEYEEEVLKALNSIDFQIHNLETNREAFEKKIFELLEELKKEEDQLIYLQE